MIIMDSNKYLLSTSHPTTTYTEPVVHCTACSLLLGLCYEALDLLLQDAQWARTVQHCLVEIL